MKTAAIVLIAALALLTSHEARAWMDCRPIGERYVATDQCLAQAEAKTELEAIASTGKDSGYLDCLNDWVWHQVLKKDLGQDVDPFFNQGHAPARNILTNTNAIVNIVRVAQYACESRFGAFQTELQDDTPPAQLRNHVAALWVISLQEWPRRTWVRTIIDVMASPHKDAAEGMAAGLPEAPKRPLP